jgi:hypothetical protein
MQVRKHGWIGIIDGAAHQEKVIDTYGEAKQVVVYMSRKDARKRYESVRKVKLWDASQANRSGVK